MILDIEESHGGIVIAIEHGDPIWGLPVDPRTGKKPDHKILVVD